MKIKVYCLGCGMKFVTNDFSIAEAAEDFHAKNQNHYLKKKINRRDRKKIAIIREEERLIQGKERE